MKLLGLRLCSHDSNVTYYDGEQLKYKSFERDFQVKHFGFEGIYGMDKNTRRVEYSTLVCRCNCHSIDSYVYNEIDVVRCTKTNRDNRDSFFQRHWI